MYAKCWNCNNDIDISNQIIEAYKSAHDIGFSMGYQNGIRDAILGENLNK